MIKTKEDLTNKQFGKLTVIKQTDDYVSPQGVRKAQWLCQCECGSEPKIILQESLKNLRTTSCGCNHTEYLCQKNKEGHKTNEYSDKQEDQNGCYYIGIAHNTGTKFYIDDIDFEKIQPYCWSEQVDSKGYHYLSTNDPNTRKTLKIQWLIVGKNYDHIDRNALNNRRYNLRQATTSQQQFNQKKQSNNTSGYIGVYWNKNNKRWFAQLGINNQDIHLGYFDNKEDALIARLKAEKKYCGEFAPQKDLFKQYNI